MSEYLPPEPGGLVTDLGLLLSGDPTVDAFHRCWDALGIDARGSDDRLRAPLLLMREVQHRIERRLGCGAGETEWLHDHTGAPVQSFRTCASRAHSQGAWTDAGCDFAIALTLAIDRPIPTSDLVEVGAEADSTPDNVVQFPRRPVEW